MAKKTETEAELSATTPSERPRKRKPPPHAWKAGQSGNPKGRPRSGQSLSEAVRQHVSPKALIDRMKWLADNAESEMVRFHAVNWLANRGHGKAVEHHEVVLKEPDVAEQRIAKMTEEQRDLMAMTELEGDPKVH